jgi:hypothetical protein
MAVARIDPLTLSALFPGACADMQRNGKRKAVGTAEPSAAGADFMETDVDEKAAVPLSAAGRSVDGEPAAKRGPVAAESNAALGLSWKLSARPTPSTVTSTKRCAYTRTHAHLKRCPVEALPVALSAAFRVHGVRMLPPLQQLIGAYSNPDLNPVERIKWSR